LVFLNQDTRVQPGWLAALVDELGSDHSAGLTTSKLLIMSQPDQIQLGGQDVHYTGLITARGFGAPAASLSRPQAVGAVSGASFALTRQLWQELGGFDERFYMYYEETDLSWRAQLAGYRCLYAPGSVLYHDYRPGRPSPLRSYYSFRNRYLMLLKNWRWRTLLLLLPGLVLAELIDWRLALGRGRRALAAKARANLWLLAHGPRLWRLHTTEQDGRTRPDAEILRNRTCRLEPREMQVGPIGRGILSACNFLFWLNHRLALAVCRWAGW
jgi:GT2 family glycosyltransferase